MGNLAGLSWVWLANLAKHLQCWEADSISVVLVTCVALSQEDPFFSCLWSWQASYPLHPTEPLLMPGKKKSCPPA